MRTAIIVILAILHLGPVALSAHAEAVAPPPPAIEDIVRLLDRPEVRTWLEEVRTANAPYDAVILANPPASRGLADRLSGVREHFRAVATAIPQFPGELARATNVLRQEMTQHGSTRILVLVTAFVLLGYGSERLFWRATARTRAWIGQHTMSSVPNRLRMIGMRLGFGLALVAIFGLGSIGAFLLFEWPPLLRQIVLAFLLAVLVVRLVVILGRVILVPGGHDIADPDRYRVIPMGIDRARFWHRRIAVFVGYYAFGRAAVELLDVLAFPPALREAAAYLLGLGLLAIGLEAVWRRPRIAAMPANGRFGGTPLSILLSIYGVLLWLLWVAGLAGLFWLAVVALLTPKTIAVGQAAVTHLLRPPQGSDASGNGVLEVCIERGLRAALIVAAAMWLADAWNIDPIALTDRDTLATRLLRGALTSVVVVLLADFLWQVIKVAVDRKLAETENPTEPGSEHAMHQGRLRTLLPIFRNVIFAVLAVVALLMVLSALGVEIGPLIAGAGVAGVAIGFGAQTLVKDVISGVFYLLDDAFRVGEYIQSGSFKGTVESFSLRSVKLRHHRGPVYTVPFGELGAVQNMSRDWVIDKFQINVTYDTDLEKARKLIKRIGQDMAADPEFAPHIIEPLKMQGVEQFGDFAIQIRMKMTTRPGEQFVIRRKAFARIKQAFDENGIRFAVPTVQVAGGGEAGPAVAHQGLQLVKPAGPAA